jgi:predicted RNase H-like nuclease (RuvC/YqgF family)
MEQEIDSLAAQVEQLEENQGIRGAYNPATTKVLEFRDSPDRVEHAIRTATLERLKSENEALLRRIGNLETSGVRTDQSQQQDLVPKESLATLNAEIERLKTAVAQKDKMLQRISQVRFYSVYLTENSGTYSS